MNLRSIFLSLMSIPFFLSAEILEIEYLRDVKSHINSKETLVIFDIDNTLLEADSHLGSVAWGDFVARDLESKGISKEEAQEVVSVLWRAVQPYIKVKAVDKEISQIIRDIQAQEVEVMCLTARVPQELPCTLKQLDFIGVNIQAMAPVVEFKEMTTLNRMAFYSHGILFATPLNKKSEVLITFMKKNKLPYKQVIFVDDKLHHVQDVKDVLEKEGIDCIAMRFSGADKRVGQFDPIEAELQWKHFQKNMTANDPNVTKSCSQSI